MAKEALIKLKTKPKRPKRRKVKYRTELTEGMSLGKLLESFRAEDNLDDVYYEEDRYQDYYDREYVSTTSYFTIEREENDEEYQQQLDRYETRLAKYEKWYKENEEVILAEVARRKQKLEEKAKIDTEKTMKRLQKQQKMVEKDLARLEKRLRK